MPGYLIDSNVFLEGFLKQEKSSFAFSFLSNANPKDLYISKFSLYSIMLILINRNLLEQYVNFIGKFIPDINIVELGNDELLELGEIVINSTGLDFDDAYQYLCVKKYKLSLVSFDKDFDKTDIERIDPSN